MNKFKLEFKLKQHTQPLQFQRHGVIGNLS